MMFDKKTPQLVKWVSFVTKIFKAKAVFSTFLEMPTVKFKYSRIINFFKFLFNWRFIGMPCFRLQNSMNRWFWYHSFLIQFSNRYSWIMIYSFWIFDSFYKICLIKLPIKYYLCLCLFFTSTVYENQGKYLLCL